MVKKRVAVAMSGGVDSSVCAYLLKSQGYECIGLTMCFGLDIGSSTSKRPTCCGQEGIRDAKKVANKLGIRHYVVNLAKELKEKVIAKFCKEYFSGRTPNPCIDCNRFIKFDALFKKARQLQCNYLATGHYARIVYDAGSKRYLLKKGIDKLKEQSYFLYAIKKSNLPSILMPLGNLTKASVRELAREAALPVANKLSSQEICFLPGADYREFLKTHLSAGRQGLSRIGRRMHADIKAGDIVDKRGKVLGQHKGIPFYTIGQRDGLGVSYKERIYVVDIDLNYNRIIVGAKKDTYSSGLLAKDPKFLLTDRLEQRLVLDSKIRYNHPQVPSKLIFLPKNRIKVEFSKPQMSVAPGQAVVFYDGDILVGGATIESRL